MVCWCVESSCAYCCRHWVDPKKRRKKTIKFNYGCFISPAIFANIYIFDDLFALKFPFLQIKHSHFVIISSDLFVSTHFLHRIYVILLSPQTNVGVLYTSTSHILFKKEWLVIFVRFYWRSSQKWGHLRRYCSDRIFSISHF